jgi:hypothetical protein
MTRAAIIQNVCNLLSYSNTCVAVFDGADRNKKGDMVGKSGLFIFFEALASENPIPQPSGKEYTASSFVVYFMLQSNGTDGDTLEKMDYARRAAVEFIGRLRWEEAVKLYPLGEAVQSPSLNYVYDQTDTLLCGVGLTATVNYDPQLPIIPCE